MNSTMRLDARLLEICQQTAHHLLVLARIVGQIDASIALMADAARFSLSRADECQASHQRNIGEGLLNIRLHADSVLNHHHNSLLVEQWRKQVGQQMIVHRLQAHQDDVASRHFAGGAMGKHIVEMKRAVT